MKKIYKYYVPVGISKLRIPEFSEFLHFGFQGNGLYIWALIEEEERLVEYEVNVIGTGWDITDDSDVAHYIGTTQTPEGLVWHAFLVNSYRVVIDDDEDILNRHV